MSLKKLDYRKEDFEKEAISRRIFGVKQLTEVSLEDKLRLVQQKDKSHSQRLAENSDF